MTAIDEIDDSLADATTTKNLITDARQNLLALAVDADKHESEKLQGRIAFADWLAVPTLKQAEGALRDKRADLQKIQGLKREMERAKRGGDLQGAAGLRLRYLDSREAVSKEGYVRDLDNAHSVVGLVGLLRLVLGPRDDEGGEEGLDDEGDYEDDDEEDNEAGGEKDDEQEDEQDEEGQNYEPETDSVLWTILEE